MEESTDGWLPEYNLTPEEEAGCATAVEGDVKLRCEASQNAKVLLRTWYESRKDAVAKIKSLFDANGIYLKPRTIHATTFSDLYKWTMAPVISKMESFKDGNVQVTFGIDLRDKTTKGKNGKDIVGMRDALKASRKKKEIDVAAGVDITTDEYVKTDLETRIWIALKGLENRPFDRATFMAPLKGARSAILNDTQIDAIISGGTLVEEGGVKPLNTKYEHPFDDKSVSVSFYFNPSAVYAEGEEPGIHFIEATGPWHRVSWLETSVMQCVYEAKLRYDLEINKKTYMQWLEGALLRCAKSVAYTRLIQSAAPAIKPALFTGRRTGGLLFLLLQNLFMADHFKQFGPTYWDESFVNISTLNRLPEGPTHSLGTSSCDCWYILTQQLGLPCLNPAGTHAHELSMVSSTLFPQLDQKSPNNPQGLPITQIIGHYLYWKLVQTKTGGPMPMLPDTLGTRAFMKAATYITVPNPVPNAKDELVPFLTVINNARQDSGSLQDFVDNMRDFGYKGGMMASEIDTTDKLLEASTLGYASFGAGGFFGDSEKVWGRKDIPSNSMAVKAVRVRWAGEAIPGISYIQQHPQGGVVGYPIKIGDPQDKSAPVLGGKLSLDKNLEPAILGPIVEYAKTLYGAHVDGTVTGSKPLAELFDERSDNGMPLDKLSDNGMTGGRRLTRKQYGRRATVKRSGTRATIKRSGTRATVKRKLIKKRATRRR